MKCMIIAVLAAVFMAGCYNTHDRPVPVLTTFEITDQARGLDTATNGENIAAVWMIAPEEGRWNMFAVFNSYGQIQEGPYRLLTHEDDRLFSRYPRVFWSNGNWLLLWSQDQADHRTVFMKTHSPGDEWRLDDAVLLLDQESMMQTSFMDVNGDEILISWRDSRDETTPQSYAAFFDSNGERLTDDLRLGHDELPSDESRAVKIGDTYYFTVSVVPSDLESQLFLRSFNVVSGEFTDLGEIISTPAARLLRTWEEDGIICLIYQSYNEEGGSETREIRFSLSGEIVREPNGFGHDPSHTRAVSVHPGIPDAIFQWVDDSSDEQSIIMEQGPVTHSVLPWDSPITSTSIEVLPTRLVGLWTDQDAQLNFFSMPY